MPEMSFDFHDTPSEAQDIGLSDAIPNPQRQHFLTWSFVADYLLIITVFGIPYIFTTWSNMFSNQFLRSYAQDHLWLATRSYSASVLLAVVIDIFSPTHSQEGANASKYLASAFSPMREGVLLGGTLLISAAVLLLLGPNFDGPNPGVMPTLSHWTTYMPPFLDRRFVLATVLLTTWGMWYGIRAKQQPDGTTREHLPEDQQSLKQPTRPAQLERGTVRSCQSWLRSVFWLVMCGTAAAIVLAIGATRAPTSDLTGLSHETTSPFSSRN